MSDEGKLFVGGLSYDTDEDSLSHSFSKYGSIEKVDVIRDRETGRSRGFGFVKYHNADDAKDAMLAMDGKIVDGRNIRVDEAGKQGSRRGGGGFGGGSRGSRGGRGRDYSRDGAGYYDRGYGGDRQGYGDRGFRGGDRSFGGGSGGEYRYPRGNGGYKNSRNEGYDGYASHE